jgi:hypothetical protein
MYSVGSNNQFDFEEELLSRFQCETHTFDPTVAGKNALPHVTTFHKLGNSYTVVKAVRIVNCFILSVASQNY